MRVDHIGYAVKDIEKAKKAFTALGYTFGETIDDSDRNVYLSFGTLDDTCVELVAPADRSTLSPVDMQLGKLGPTPYHICYKSSNIEQDIADLERTVLKLPYLLHRQSPLAGRGSFSFIRSLSVSLKL